MLIENGLPVLAVKNGLPVLENGLPVLAVKDASKDGRLKVPAGFVESWLPLWANNNFFAFAVASSTFPAVSVNADAFVLLGSTWQGLSVANCKYIYAKLFLIC